MQRIAVPIRESRVSPVFDAASTLLLVDVEDGREAARRTERIEGYPGRSRAQRLGDLGVEVLLCGAISRPLAGAIAAEGIELVAWRCGSVDEVLEAYLKGRIMWDCFSMPGRCGRGRARQGG